MTKKTLALLVLVVGILYVVKKVIDESIYPKSEREAIDKLIHLVAFFGTLRNLEQGYDHNLVPVEPSLAEQLIRNFCDQIFPLLPTYVRTLKIGNVTVAREHGEKAWEIADLDLYVNFYRQSVLSSL